MTESNKNRRLYVRGAFTYFVEYKVITPEEFKLHENKTTRLPALNQIMLMKGPKRTDYNSSVPGSNDMVINLLIQVNAKMDRILSLFSKSDKNTGSIRQGIGRNISASGLNMVIDQTVAKGQILQMHIELPKMPFIGFDLFGEIVRVTPVNENGMTRFQIALKFLDLDESDREKIIAFIFQVQRKIIRESKTAVNY